MAKADSKTETKQVGQKKCFVIMPISVPEHLLPLYDNNPKHFSVVFEDMIKPALETLNLEAIPPSATAADVIHGEIIKNIQESDYVICDMSSLNANVFFELGMRTAVNKSVILIKDDLTSKIPFDLAPINTFTYNSKLTYRNVKQDVTNLTDHCKVSIHKSDKQDGKNALWHYFGLTVPAPVVQGMIGEKADIERLEIKLDAVMGEIRRQSQPQPLRYGGGITLGAPVNPMNPLNESIFGSVNSASDSFKGITSTLNDTKGENSAAAHLAKILIRTNETGRK
ncbi:MAG: hypothetical protein SFY80_03590 [Verrucomicrobiota bacterium]|nr:hypothetical protein [Verrucomicrobiota bacterium]